MAAYFGTGSALASTGIYNEMARIPRPMREIPNTFDLKVSIETILISAFLFIGILVWFEFIRVAYDVAFTPGSYPSGIVLNRFILAIFLTCLAILLVVITYRIANIRSSNSYNL